MSAGKGDTQRPTDHGKFSENFDMIDWKKQFDTDAPKQDLEARLAQVRKELLELSEMMTQRMSEEEHIGIQLKLKSVQEKREADDGVS
jgi:hypothetical protein